jgi:puromycin-sensitive aminopeptidase
MPPTAPTHDLESKDFRLSHTIRPKRYAFTLKLDLSAGRFAGSGAIDITLAEPTSDVVLHGVDLDVRARVGDRAATVSVHPRSQTVRLRFAEALPKGETRLAIEWEGPFSPGLRGLYRAGPLAVTQFEAADARRVFPCFDEPGFKAPWALTVRAPRDRTTLSNGKIVDEKPGDGWVDLTFAETPPLPSYLIALACGPLTSATEQTVCGTPVRTFAVPEKIHLTAVGQEVAVAVLPRLERYFGLPYAFGKLDQVAVPDFEAGAMENAGLITYRETALLLDPATASLPAQKRVAEVITHELAHQWFGNWVTMEWWDDLWLNEAFATWMAFKIVDGWRPQWRLWLEFDKGKAEALSLDALSSTHPIRAEVPNAEAAGESFDVITYEKGGAVLRMIEGYLGEESFRGGIQVYMKRFARANATSGDLWRALEEASPGVPVLALANAWIRQSGHPLVTVTLEPGGVRLSQTRFFSAPGASGDEVWPVPVVLRFEDDGGVREHRVLLRERDASVPLTTKGKVKWLCGNGGATGFYRVAYDSATVKRVAQNRASLHPPERIGLLSDTWALVRADLRTVREFLELLECFDDEDDEAVLGELVGRLGMIEYRLVHDDDRDRFRQFVSDLLGPPLGRVGWDFVPGETDEARLRRAALARGVALIARKADAVDALRSRLDRFLAGELAALEPNLHDIAVTAVARAGAAARFGRFRSLYEAERDPMFRRRYLLALPAFEDPPLAERARALLLDPFVPTQDFSSYVAVLLANPTAREPSWDQLRTEWPRFLERLSGAPALLRRVIEAVGLLPEPRHYQQARAFFRDHRVESAEQAIAQTLERMKQDTELRERAQPEIGTWLTEVFASR